MDVVGFGALNLDRLYYVDEILNAGRHGVINSLYASPGGSAANTIAWLADSKYKTGFIGAVGKDNAGKILLDDFKKRKVNTTGVRKLKGSSGIVVGLVDKHGERTLYPYPGVNNDFKLDSKQIKLASKSKFVHLSSFVGDKQFSEQLRLVNKLPSKVKLSFSPGDLYTSRGLKALTPFLERTNVLFLNEDEVVKLTWQGYSHGADQLNSMGIETVVVTLRDKGCYVSTKQDKGRVKCTACTPKDTTGAGDSFTAGFLAALLDGKSPMKAGKAANNQAKKCIRIQGARC